MDLLELGLHDFYDAEHLSLTLSAGTFSSWLADRVAELLDHPALSAGAAASSGKPDPRDR